MISFDETLNKCIMVKSLFSYKLGIDSEICIVQEYNNFKMLTVLHQTLAVNFNFFQILDNHHMSSGTQTSMRILNFLSIM